MVYPSHPDLTDLIVRLARELRARQLPFMLIGGQAVLLHGEPRLTQDIDVTLGAGPDRLSDTLAVCHAAALEPLVSNIESFVRETFVLPAADPVTGIRVDLIFSTTPYEAQAIGHALLINLAGEAIPFATAEDLILHKLFAGRARDLEDVSGIIQRQSTTLDWDYIQTWALEFSAVPGREAMVDTLEALRRQARRA
ncbi:MAG: nucleotidyl transferase AbiEii/AbiGii toxin family protein [Longimicrobiales bacterium]